MRKCLFLLCSIIITLTACQEVHEHTAPAIRDSDSVPVMTTYGVNTLISDSGVIKYRIVAERWEINTNKKPSCWIFNKGVLLTQFDEKKHIQGYIMCDSAIYYDQERHWVLRGRVHILTAQGLDFRSQQLDWDEANHKIWSKTYSHLITPERELEGNYFVSDEQMNDYEIRNTKGWGLFENKQLAPSAPNLSGPKGLVPLDSIHKTK